MHLRNIHILVATQRLRLLLAIHDEDVTLSQSSTTPLILDVTGLAAHCSATPAAKCHTFTVRERRDEAHMQQTRESGFA